MAPPRFLFTARVLPSAVGGAPRLAWRLVGGNNHELGRSTPTFEDLSDCLDAVREVQQQVTELDAELSTVRGHRAWRWRLRLAGEQVAESRRVHDRERDCELHLAQFLAAVPRAELSTSVAEHPPRRELLRPDFVVPRRVPVDVVPPADLGDGVDAGDLDQADEDLTQDLPRDVADELSEAW